MHLSLYERLGGEGAIIAAVDRFYEKVLADEMTRPFFADLDMETQSRKQVAFMAWAFGGPEEWKGRPLKAAHTRLVRQGLSDAHFDAVAGHLEATLRELGVEDELIKEVMAIVAGTREQVLGR
jgi:hemoglobin